MFLIILLFLTILVKFILSIYIRKNYSSAQDVSLTNIVNANVSLLAVSLIISGFLHQQEAFSDKHWVKFFEFIDFWTSLVFYIFYYAKYSPDMVQKANMAMIAMDVISLLLIGMVLYSEIKQFKDFFTMQKQERAEANMGEFWQASLDENPQVIEY